MALPSQQWPCLSNEEPTYRILTRARDVYPATGEPTPNAFIRRQQSADGSLPDPDGVSLDLLGGRSEAQTIQEGMTRFRGTRGVARIYVGDVRSVQDHSTQTIYPLDVIQDEPSHAYIDKLPQMPADLTTLEGQRIQEEAEYYGEELRKMAKRVHP